MLSENEFNSILPPNVKGHCLIDRNVFNIIHSFNDFSDINQGDTEFSQACRLYFKHIFDLDYAVDLHNMICQQIDQLCQDLPVIHITHFDYEKLYQFPNMINFYELFLQHRGPVNHYDQYGNGQVYQSLLKVL